MRAKVERQNKKPNPDEMKAGTSASSECQRITLKAISRTGVARKKILFVIAKRQKSNSVERSEGGSTPSAPVSLCKNGWEDVQKTQHFGGTNEERKVKRKGPNQNSGG